MGMTSDELLVKIGDPDSQLPVADLHKLSDLESRATATLIKTWPTIDTHRRREVMRHLADICQTNFEVDFGPIASMGIRDEDSLVRLAAIEAFWDSEDPEIIDPLLRLSQNDPDPAVRAGAVQALGQFVLLGELGQISSHAFGQLTSVLLKLARDGERTALVRCRALEALASADLSELPDLIAQAYRSNEEAFKISAVSAMGRTVDPKWAPIIMAELDNVSPGMRYNAARAAGRLKLQECLPQLIALLDDPDPEVVVASIETLGEIGGGEARAALENLLDYDDEIGDMAERALEAMDLTAGFPAFPRFYSER